MKKHIKRTAIIAASAATVFSLAVATPSLSHAGKSQSGTSTSKPVKAPHAHATLAATVTAVPTTVTDLKAASHGAKFVAYKLAADATAIPATQPTTGGHPVRLIGTAITGGVLTGNLNIDAGAASTTTKYAIYNAAGVGTLVTVVVDAAGAATATSATAITAAYVAPTEPALGEGKAAKGERGHKGKRH